MPLNESMSLSVRRRWDYALSTFDERLLHLGGPVMAVEFVVETAGVADRMSGGIASPEGGCGGVAILAGYQEVAW